LIHIKALACALAGLLVALLTVTAQARPAERVDVYLFWAIGCPHCEREIEFLKRLEADEPRLRVHYLELTREPASRNAFAAVVKKFAIEDPAVPLTVAGDAAMIGYATDATSGAELRRRIDACLAAGCPDTVGPLVRASGGDAGAAAAGARERGASRAIPPTISIPLLGEIRTADLSLPLLTVVLGTLDGFNPCAMWVLVFLIGLLLGMQDRARMWVLGTAFIAGSALVYFLFMAAWLNFLLFIGAVTWVRAGVGLVALGGGFYYLREYYRNPDAACKVTAPQARRRVLENLRRLAKEDRFWLALLGILALAFAVNLVELLCSAGLPAVYTQVLALSDIPAWQYYAYLALYILVFMLDDLVVFVAAMKTLQITGVTSRYTHLSHLAGGVVLLAIGALLLLRPDWLMFG
jgi:cytochrome c biogenesis protein CcdA/thiol-disulfide isomerase/thioredoxin